MSAALLFAAFGSAAAVEDPVVSAQANGDTNTRTIGQCYVGVQFASDGEEYELLASGTPSATTEGTWLDAGTPGQVWVQFNRTGGTASAWDSHANSTRYNLASGQTFSLADTTQDDVPETIIGTFSFYDAASGGNLLQTTSGATWSADYQIKTGMM